jgi:hypothetical protein
MNDFLRNNGAGDTTVRTPMRRCGLGVGQTGRSALSAPSPPQPPPGEATAAAYGVTDTWAGLAVAGAAAGRRFTVALFRITWTVVANWNDV